MKPGVNTTNLPIRKLPALLAGLFGQSQDARVTVTIVDKRSDMTPYIQLAVFSQSSVAS